MTPRVSVSGTPNSCRQAVLQHISFETIKAIIQGILRLLKSV